MQRLVTKYNTYAQTIYIALSLFSVHGYGQDVALRQKLLAIIPQVETGTIFTGTDKLQIDILNAEISIPKLHQLIKRRIKGKNVKAKERGGQVPQLLIAEGQAAYIFSQINHGNNNIVIGSPVNVAAKISKPMPKTKFNMEWSEVSADMRMQWNHNCVQIFIAKSKATLQEAQRSFDIFHKNEGWHSVPAQLKLDRTPFGSSTSYEIYLQRADGASHALFWREDLQYTWISYEKTTIIRDGESCST